jgi:GNAT superfamily N-acetyltransferase
MTTVNVREATRDDLDVVWEFVRKKAAFDNWLDRLEATPQSLADAMFCEHPVMGVLLAETSSRTVGFASYFFTFSTYLARRCLWLDDLYVDEDVRGGGIGTELLRALARVSIRHGCPRLEWVTAASNAKAIGFYERMGADVHHAIRVCRLNESAIISLAEGRT